MPDQPSSSPLWIYFTHGAHAYRLIVTADGDVRALAYDIGIDRTTGEHFLAVTLGVIP